MTDCQTNIIMSHRTFPISFSRPVPRVLNSSDDRCYFKNSTCACDKSRPELIASVPKSSITCRNHHVLESLSRNHRPEIIIPKPLAQNHHVTNHKKTPRHKHIESQHHRHKCIVSNSPSNNPWNVSNSNPVGLRWILFLMSARAHCNPWPPAQQHVCNV